MFRYNEKRTPISPHRVPPVRSNKVKDYSSSVGSPCSLKKLKDVEDKLAELCAQSNYAKIDKEISGLECEEGRVNVEKLWKLKKKLSSTCRDPPTAIVDKEGNLLTSPKEIEALALEVFEKRLKKIDLSMMI